MKKYEFDVVVRPDFSAGILGFTDKITIIVDSGDPGGGPGEFERFIEEVLHEWYDGADIWYCETEDAPCPS